MRKLFMSLAVLALPIGGAMSLASCATFEQVKPKSARQALAEAEIMFNGVAQSAFTLYNNNVISDADFRYVLAQMDTASKYLDAAFIAIKAGEAIKANDNVVSTLAILSELALKLSTARENYVAPPSLPPIPGA